MNIPWNSLVLAIVARKIPWNMQLNIFYRYSGKFGMPYRDSNICNENTESRFLSQSFSNRDTKLFASPKRHWPGLLTATSSATSHLVFGWDMTPSTWLLSRLWMYWVCALDSFLTQGYVESPVSILALGRHCSVNRARYLTVTLHTCILSLLNFNYFMESSSWLVEPPASPIKNNEINVILLQILQIPDHLLGKS